MDLLDKPIIPRMPRKRPGVWLSMVSAGVLVGCSSSFHNSYEARLAEHLTETGASMYGAYWCPHCATQKEYFGGAAERIPYVECDPEGIDNQAQLCRDLDIRAYPTWIIEGEYYEGTQPLRALAAASAFEGATTEADSVVPAGEASPAQE